LAWFHVPKTGTSICNTFYHTPALCPAFSVDNYMSDSEGLGSWSRFWGERDEVCPGAFSDSYFVGAFRTQVREIPDDFDLNYAHVGIGGLTAPLYHLNRGHFVTMLRQPEQRLISMYYYYGAKGFFGVDNLSTRTWTYDTESPSLREYAEWNAGCTVKQLTMDVLVPCATVHSLTSEDVSVAMNVLQEGFAFVGITEQWDLSVCLFRAMFGGQCVASDFANIRPGKNHSTSGYDTSELYGWVDVVDGPLYAESALIFESTRSVYGVDPSSCTSMCRGQSD
jgi:hypothetical protein